MAQIIELSNGVRIVSEKRSFARSIAVGIFVKNGSKNESEAENGISHFIEHMLFKGTKNRSAEEIAEQMDSIGAQLNAYTAKEYTCYYVRGLDSHFDIFFDVLSDMFLNSSFNDEDIEKERRVIIEEIHMYEDTPEELVLDSLQPHIWKNNSLGRNILGSVESISGINRDKFFEFIGRRYVGENIVVSIAGNFTDKNIEKIKSVFGSVAKKAVDEVWQKPVYTPEIVKTKKDIEQLNLAVVFEGVSLRSGKNYAMNFLNTYFGGGMSSRLYQSIREKNGLAYTVYSFNLNNIDAGLFSIYVGLSPGQLPQVCDLIYEEIDLLKKAGISREVIEKTARQIKSSYILSMEGVLNTMSAMGRNLTLIDKVFTIDEMCEIIDGINESMLNELIDEVFDYSKASYSLVGKVDEISDSCFKK